VHLFVSIEHKHCLLRNERKWRWNPIEEPLTVEGKKLIHLISLTRFTIWLFWRGIEFNFLEENLLSSPEEFINFSKKRGEIFNITNYRDRVISSLIVGKDQSWWKYLQISKEIP